MPCAVCCAALCVQGDLRDIVLLCLSTFVFMWMGGAMYVAYAHMVAPEMFQPSFGQ